MGVLRSAGSLGRQFVHQRSGRVPVSTKDTTIAGLIPGLGSSTPEGGIVVESLKPSICPSTVAIRDADSKRGILRPLRSSIVLAGSSVIERRAASGGTAGGPVRSLSGIAALVATVVPSSGGISTHCASGSSSRGGRLAGVGGGLGGTGGGLGGDGSPGVLYDILSSVGQTLAGNRCAD